MDYNVLKLFYVIGWVLFGMASLWLREDYLEELQGIQESLYEVVEFVSRGPSLDFLDSLQNGD